MIWKDYVPHEIAARYEVKDFKHAAAILANEFSSEAREIFAALADFSLHKSDVTQPGGNESEIPPRFANLLRPLGWLEDTLSAKTIVNDREVTHDTHKVDFLKGRVAFDLEWNSKDQTYDRDLYAFRAFFEYDRISVGILVTRSNDLDSWFDSLGTYVDKKRSYETLQG